MSDETTPLPCPWCGVDMKLHAINYPWADGDPGWNIWHEDIGEAIKRKCPMEMGGYGTREEAIAAWNTRADYHGYEQAAIEAWESVKAWNTRTELGSGTKPCYAADENYKRCKYSVNRGWCDNAPFLVWDDTGHLFITMGGLKTWDVTDDAKKWFAELGSGTCEWILEHSGTLYDKWRCSECGYLYVDSRTDGGATDLDPNFCPNCGRNVVSA